MLRMRTLALALTMAAGLATQAWADPRCLPGDTEVVVNVNVKQILDSELVKSNKDLVNQLRVQLEAKLAEDEQVAKIVKALGFDPLTDLASITYAHPGTKDPQAGFIVVKGKFNLDKIQTVTDELATTKGDQFKVHKSGAQRLYEFTPGNGGRAFAAFAGNDTLLFSMDLDSVQAGLARLAGTRKSELRKELKDMLSTTSDKQSFSFLITNKAITNLSENAPVPNAEAIGQVTQTIDGISGAITAAKDIDFQLGVAFKDEPTAKKMVGAANGGLLFARTMIAQKAMEDEKLAPAVDIANTIRIVAQGSNVIARGQISYANLEKLIKLANQFKQ